MENPIKAKILLQGMEFYAFHGYYPIEQQIGGKFVVDLVLETSINNAALHDNLDGTIDYQAVYKLVKEIMQENVKLIEHLAYKIQNAILQQFKVSKVSITVTKISPSIGGPIASTAICLA